MATTNLPPQAYTREMLSLAYDWLKKQPASVRDLASSADDLVALYLQARRRPNTSPVSAQNFKSDLKDLAKGLRQFESKEAPTQEPSHGAESALSKTEPHPQPSTTPSAAPLDSMVPTPSEVKAQQQQPIKTPAPQIAAPSLEQSVTTGTPMAGLSLDKKSQEFILQVQKQLNLGSKQEALRMLLALGFDRIKEILPKP